MKELMLMLLMKFLLMFHRIIVILFMVIHIFYEEDQLKQRIIREYEVYSVIIEINKITFFLNFSS